MLFVVVALLVGTRVAVDLDRRALPEGRPLRSAVPVALLAVPGVGAKAARKLHSIPAEQRVGMLLELCFGDPASVPADWQEAAAAEVRRRAELPYAPSVLAASARGLIGHYLLPRRSGLWRQAAKVRPCWCTAAGTSL